MTDNRLVLTTTGSREEADTIARTLVEERLAACVNIIPQMHSVYRWQDKVDEADECLLLIKTFSTAIDRVRERIRQLNSYELPECISLSIDGGCKQYLKWIDNSVK
jgi:periplasmic divalent cation tolerance protein